MKKVNTNFRRILAFVLVLALTLLCSCSADKKVAVKFPKTVTQLATGELAKNENYTLSWDKEKHNVILTDNASGRIWATVPYEFSQTEGENEQLNSPIQIEYITSANYTKETQTSYEKLVKAGRVASKAIKNGIEFTYYFDAVGISVPVQYTLRNDSLAVTVDFKNATESTEKLLSVAVAPFLCSVKNGNEDSYVVVPSGSGAIMSTNVTSEGTRSYSSMVYDRDYSSLVNEILTEDEQVRLPIFGVKDGNNAIMGIIEDGDEMAQITAKAGDECGYSNAYTSFYARGYDLKDMADHRTGGFRADAYQVTDDITVKSSTVAFYPLSGDKATYVGMAEKYREYLNGKGYLKKTTDTEQAYALYLKGAAHVEELFVGFPVVNTHALTTFSQAEKIVKELYKATKTTPEVQLLGFGESGLNPGKVAGGFDFASAVGSKKDRESLESYCKKNGINLYTDFDLVFFSKGGNGYNSLFNATKSALMRKVNLYYKNKATWNFEKNVKYFVLSRASLFDAVKKLNKTIDKKSISNISLSTLGSVAYSDYDDLKYYARGNMLEDAEKLIKSIDKNCGNIATQSANAYAAVLSDSVFNVSTFDGSYNCFYKAIPLYQMVFKGYVPMYSTAVNTTECLEESIMLAVQSGTGLGFSVVGEYSLDFAQSPFVGLNGSDYKGNKQDIIDAVKACKDYYKAINGATIVDYEFVTEDVTLTTFSNGVKLYANHSGEKVDSPAGELKAYGFIYEKEAV